MASPSVLPPPLPRLRVSRTPRNNSDNPQSGPSRLSDPIASNSIELNIDDEPSRNLLSSFSIMDASATLPEDTPAARLRAVMARLPPSSSPSTPLPTPPSPSERESDFDQPHFGSSTASFAQESIRSIFSRARRDPGDTPRKDNRPRRNSFDVTEVQASPRAQKVRQERARNIGRRQSMSDEEIERHSHRSDLSDADVFSTHSKTPRAFGSICDSANNSIDTQAMVDDLGNSQATPPAATSTPQHSLQMTLNSYLQAQSNLLDHDSEMQRGLQVFDSDEEESPKATFSTASRKKQLDPQETIRSRTADRSKASSSTSRSLVDLKRSQSFSTPKPDPPKSRTSHSSSRSADLSHKNSLHSFPKSTGYSGLARRDSMNSVNSFDDRATSEGSHADHRERMAELKSQRSDDLERQQNMPHPHTPSSPSQSSVDAISLSRSGGGHHPHNSFSSARSVSPASSRTSVDEEREREREVQAEVDHERERNWNSPQPTWHNQFTHRSHSSRTNSPTPPSPSPTTSTSSHSSHKGARPRMDSKVSARGTPSPRLKTPDSPSRSRVRPISHSSHSNSPLPPGSTAPRSTSSRYSHSNASISPTHEDGPRAWSTPSKPTPSDTSQRTKYAPRLSPSPSTTSPIKNKSSGLPKASNHSKGRAGTVNRDKPISRQAAEISNAYDGQSTDTDGEDLLQESTPTLKTTTLTQSQTGKRKSPSPQLWSQTARDESRSYRPIDPPATPPPSSPLSLPSTPPTLPISEPLFATHHRRSSFSQLEYQTPSPPKGLPELPGPPSGSEDEQDTEPVSQVTALKTPRPPGAWAYTPASRLARPNSLPVDEGPQNGGPSTPENSTPLARTTSLPPQTPAPPGGWLITPKKSVRFDSPHTESDQSGAEITPNSSAEFHDENTHNEQYPSRTTRENGILKPSFVLNVDNNIPDILPTPISPSKSRRTPTVNFVDEYGQEEKPDKSHGSPRHRSAIRIVDAMGREVDDSVASLEEPLTRMEAVTHMRQGLSQIAQDLEDACQSSSDIGVTRLAELEQASRISRKQREELARKLHHADEDVRRKVVSLRESMNKSKALVPAPVSRRCPSLSWIALAIIVQLFLIIIMYLISVSRARELFLTTYYDPFYAELHMYTTTPDYTINWLSSADSPPISQGGDQFITRVLSMFADWRDTGERNGLWPPT
ncbi:hypothetical protein DFS33DRAFT_1285979 [Desarmillaria ectypa]|nr:hypothetical protein DFS33DRAFT_1285979 [Desarmillaria ectypa]